MHDKPQDPSNKPAAGPSAGTAMEGEGNYSAARRHRKSVERFIAEGQVQRAAREAAPDSPEQARDLEAAERAGRAHARK